MAQEATINIIVSKFISAGSVALPAAYCEVKVSRAASSTDDGRVTVHDWIIGPTTNWIVRANGVKNGNPNQSSKGELKMRFVILDQDGNSNPAEYRVTGIDIRQKPTSPRANKDDPYGYDT